MKEKKMNWSNRGIYLLVLIPFLIGATHSLSWGAEKAYPVKPINMVYVYGAGGPHDISSRLLADNMGKILGQPIISVYKPGGGGTLGTAFAAKSKPDGYTILVGSTSALVISPIVTKLDYKLEDFEFIGTFGESFCWLAVKGDARWNTVKEFVEEAKRFPGKLTISSYGKFSSSDFVIQLFSREANIKLTEVPYKSTPEAMTALLGGHVDAAMVHSAGGLVESGTVKMLALAGEERWEDLPKVPTFGEAGYAVAYSAWLALCAPKGTPKEALDTLRSAQKKALDLNMKEIKEGSRKVEVRTILLNPEESRAIFKKQTDVTLKVAQGLGVVAK